MSEQQFNEPTPAGLAHMARFQAERKKRLQAQRAWNDADETSLIRVQKAFERFEKFSDRHAGALTMAWAILKSIRGG